MNQSKRLDRLESTAPDQGAERVTAITILGICVENREAESAFTMPIGWNNGEQINHPDRAVDETEAAFKVRISAEIEAARQA